MASAWPESVPANPGPACGQHSAPEATCSLGVVVTAGDANAEGWACVACGESVASGAAPPSGRAERSIASTEAQTASATATPAKKLPKWRLTRRAINRAHPNHRRCRSTIGPCAARHLVETLTRAVHSPGARVKVCGRRVVFPLRWRKRPPVGGGSRFVGTDAPPAVSIRLWVEARAA